MRIATLRFRQLAVISIMVAATALTACTSSKTPDKDTLRMNLVADIKGLDPIYVSDLYSNTVAANIFDTLFTYHYLQRPLKLIPYLAESMPEASKDGLVHTIKIRKGVLFQDSEAFPSGKGRELTAQDFIYSWKRLADKSNTSDGFWIFDGKIKGLNEWRDNLTDGKAKFEDDIEGLKAVDSHTLQITLTQPYYQLYNVLAMTYASPVAKEVVDKYGKETLNHPVGTGPYKLSKWIRGNTIILDENPTWHGKSWMKYPSEGEEGDKEKGLLEDAGKALPFVKRIVFSNIIESQPAWLNFLNARFDLSPIQKDDFDSAIINGEVAPALKEKGIQLIVTPGYDTSFQAINMEDPLLGKNKNLRKAISLAANPDGFIEKFYNGRAQEAHGPITPGIGGYDKDFKNPYRGQNIEKAKQFLAKAGFPEGKGLTPITYHTTSSSTGRQSAEYFKENLAKAGIPVKVVSLSWPQFSEDVRTKKIQIYGMAWGADYPDAENFLQLFYSKNISPGPNGANYSNPTFDKLYEKALLLPDSPERTKIYKQMRDIVVEDVPWTYTGHRLTYGLFYPWLKNYKPNKIVAGSVKYYRIDNNLREQKLK